jgi:hypothetical protein
MLSLESDRALRTLRQRGRLASRPQLDVGEAPAPGSTAASIGASRRAIFRASWSAMAAERAMVSAASMNGSTRASYSSPYTPSSMGQVDAVALAVVLPRPRRPLPPRPQHRAVPLLRSAQVCAAPAVIRYAVTPSRLTPATGGVVAPAVDEARSRERAGVVCRPPAAVPDRGWQGHIARGKRPSVRRVAHVGDIAVAKLTKEAPPHQRRAGQRRRAYGPKILMSTSPVAVALLFVLPRPKRPLPP